MKKVYVITGANGFLGNNVVRLLQNETNIEIRCLVQPHHQVESLKGLNCKIFYGNITDKESLVDLFKIDEDDELFVIHAAGVVYIKSRYDKHVYDVNVIGSKNIIEQVIKNNGKLVYVSSVHALTKKENSSLIEENDSFNESEVVGHYAKSKAIVGNYILSLCKENKLNAVIIHPSAMFGMYDFNNTSLTKMITDFANGKLPIIVKGGYDFVNVKDVAQGIINVTHNFKSGECYILSGKYVSLKDFLALEAYLLNIKRKPCVLPLWFTSLLAPIVEFFTNVFRLKPLLTKVSIKIVSESSEFSSLKAQKELNYKISDIKESLNETLSYLKSIKAIK